MRNKPKLSLSTREQLALSQKAFADYLDISRSALTMYESGLRALPTPARNKLANLELLYYQLLQGTVKNKKEKSLDPRVKKHDDEAKSYMLERIDTCSFRKLIFERELKVMISEFAKVRSAAHVLKIISGEIDPDATDKGDRLWVNKQQTTTNKKLIRCGYASQALLRAKILSLTSEEAAYKKFLDTF